MSEYFLTKEEIKSIQDEWLAGQSIVNLSKKYKRDKSTISKRVLKDVRHKRDPDLIRRANQINDFAFDTLSNKTFFWIGFIFADGNIHQDKRSDSYAPQITLTVHPQDKDIIEKFCDFISFQGKIRESSYKRGKVSVPFISVSFVSRKIAKVLEYYGATARKSKTLKPKNGIQGNKYFWIGYICGDGSLGSYRVRKGKYTTFSPSIRIVGSYSMCNAFYDYCSKIVPESNARPRKHKTIYGVNYSTRPAIKLMKHFFDGENYGLTRKIQLAKKIIEENSYRLDIKRPRTKDEKNEIRRLYKQNKWSIRKIARELDIQRGVVSRILGQKSIKIRKENQTPLFDKKQSEKIIKLYKETKSMPRVRELLNKKWKMNASIDSFYKAKKRLKS